MVWLDQNNYYCLRFLFFIFHVYLVMANDFPTEFDAVVLGTGMELIRHNDFYCVSLFLDC